MSVYYPLCVSPFHSLFGFFFFFFFCCLEMTMLMTNVHVVSVRLERFLITELKISPERYRGFFCLPVWHFGPWYPARHGH